MTDYLIKGAGSICSIAEFAINGIEASEEDFVDKYDHSPEDAPAYGCGDMRADVKPPEVSVLEKYKINTAEYTEIAEMVAEEVSFGNCSQCT